MRLKVLSVRPLFGVILGLMRLNFLPSTASVHSILKGRPSMTKFKFIKILMGIFALVNFLGSSSAKAQDLSQVTLNLDGRDLPVAMYVYKPAGEGPFPVVIYSHGRSANPAQRRNFWFNPVEGRDTYWTSKGVVFLAVIRPGYGRTGGKDWENPFGGLLGLPYLGNNQYKDMVGNGGKVILETVDWVRRQPWAKKDRILLEGDSVGGLLSVVAAASNPAGVVGIVSFAGGCCSTPERKGESFEPEVMEQIFRVAGERARIPSIMFFAENDGYFGPRVVNQWFTSYKAGGSDTRLFMSPPVGANGHNIRLYGSAFWTPHLDEFVNKVGLFIP